MERNTVLLGVLVAVAGLTTLILFDVLQTVFFAVTLVIVLAPVYDRLRRFGLPPRLASMSIILGLSAVILGVLGLFVSIIYARRELFIDWIEDLPSVIEVDFGVATIDLELADVTGFAVDWLSRRLVLYAQQVPELLLKFGLVVLIVYGLLIWKGGASTAIKRVTPPSYHDVIGALYVRAEETLWAIYVIQFVTAIVTFFLALPLFYLLGYELFVILALTCAVFQFLPIVGPSFVLAAMAGFHLVAGELLPAVIVLAIGLPLVAMSPDFLLRPQLARRTARLNGTLYFVGFVGGILSMGLVGVIAGPLAVGLLAEAVALVGNHRSMLDRGFVSPDGTPRVEPPSEG